MSKSTFESKLFREWLRQNFWSIPNERIIYINWQSIWEIKVHFHFSPRYNVMICFLCSVFSFTIHEALNDCTVIINNSTHIHLIISKTAWYIFRLIIAPWWMVHTSQIKTVKLITWDPTLQYAYHNSNLHLNSNAIAINSIIIHTYPNSTYQRGTNIMGLCRSRFTHDLNNMHMYIYTHLTASLDCHMLWKMSHY